MYDEDTRMMKMFSIRKRERMTLHSTYLLFLPFFFFFSFVPWICSFSNSGVTHGKKTNTSYSVREDIYTAYRLPVRNKLHQVVSKSTTVTMMFSWAERTGFELHS